MAMDSAISWCDDTWNPWQGCHKVSPGCANCYMFTAKRRYGQRPDVVVRSARATFELPRTWERQLAAGTYRGKKRHGDTLLIFTCSWSDFFIEDADPWRGEVWAIIRETPHCTYQILTKRPERIAACLPDDWGTGYPNVWVGTSIENRRWLHRLDTLLQVPAVVRFASFEPLLGDLGDLSPWLSWLSWAIVGGESGGTRRPMDLGWLLSIVAQCHAAGVPIWVKQDSAFKDEQQGRIPADVWALKQLPLAAAAWRADFPRGAAVGAPAQLRLV
jgi:protein gp37